MPEAERDEHGEDCKTDLCPAIAWLNEGGRGIRRTAELVGRRFETGKYLAVIGG